MDGGGNLAVAAPSMILPLPFCLRSRTTAKVRLINPYTPLILAFFFAVHGTTPPTLLYAPPPLLAELHCVILFISLWPVASCPMLQWSFAHFPLSTFAFKVLQS